MKKIFSKNQQIYVKNSLDKTQDIISNAVGELSYSSFNKSTVIPVLFVYAKDSVSVEFLLKLYVHHKQGSFNIPLKTPRRRSPWVQNGIFFTILVSQCVEAFLTLSKEDETTKIDYSLYFVPIYNIKFMLSALLVSLSVAALSIWIFPEEDIIGAILFILALGNLVMWFFIAAISLPYSLLLYFSYRKYYYRIFDHVFRKLNQVQE